MNSYFDKESIQKLREIDLFTYLSIRDPAELVHVSGQTYCTAEHDSLIISNGMWNWFSRGIGGKNAIDYLVLVKDFSFIEACNEVNTIANIDIKPIRKEIKRKYSYNKKEQLEVPNFNRDMSKTKSYLQRRGIENKVIDLFISLGSLKESYKYNNALFIGFDKNNEIRYVNQRSTGEKKFGGDVSGSDKKFAFKYVGSNENKCLKLFEAPIDLMSYMSIKLLNKEEVKQENLLALGGISKFKSGNIPVGLEQYFEDYGKPNTIEIYFDRDETGIEGSRNLKKILEKMNIKVQCFYPKNGKDVNDNLQYFLSKKEKLKETLEKETKELEPDFEKF